MIEEENEYDGALYGTVRTIREIRKYCLRIEKVFKATTAVVTASNSKIASDRKFIQQSSKICIYQTRIK